MNKSIMISISSRVQGLHGCLDLWLPFLGSLHWGFGEIGVRVF